MYVLFNIFAHKPYWVVISRHHTVEAAEKEDAAIQRAIKRHNGPRSYVTTKIVYMSDPPKKGSLLDPNKETT